MEMTLQPKILGRFIVADPDICHGKPTFRGTRILVADVLDQVAAGLAWETITDEWRGSITNEAIAEAVRLSRQALLVQTDAYAQMAMDEARETDAREWSDALVGDVPDETW